ncbi:hypothetical protein B0H16DRAFT_1894428, partial [Mycena metata]
SLRSPTSKSTPPSCCAFQTFVLTLYNTPRQSLRSPTSESTPPSCRAASSKAPPALLGPRTTPPSSRYGCRC